MTKNTVRAVYECETVNATQGNNRHLLIRGVQIRHESTICKMFAFLLFQKMVRIVYICLSVPLYHSGQAKSTKL